MKSTGRGRAHHPLRGIGRRIPFLCFARHSLRLGHEHGVNPSEAECAEANVSHHESVKDDGVYSRRRVTYKRFLLGFVPSLLYTLLVPLSPTSPWAPYAGPVLASLVWTGWSRGACKKIGRPAVRTAGVLESLIVVVVFVIAARQRGFCDVWLLLFDV